MHIFYTGTWATSISMLPALIFPEVDIDCLVALSDSIVAWYK
jgi:hypothetical protein